MSSSETSGSEQQPGQLVVSSPGARLEVLDPYLRTVEGSGAVSKLDLSVPAGAYRVTARLADGQESRLVVVRPSAFTGVDLTVAFDAAAPVAGTVTENETHGMLAAELTQRSTRQPDGSTLVVVLRGLRDRPMAPLADSFDVIDDTGRLVEIPVPQPEPGAIAGGRALGWAIPLPKEGWYRVRWSESGRQPVEHGVWASPGWQTVLFVPQGPRGPIHAGTSVHLLRSGEPWDPYGQQMLAVERALAGLRGSPSAALANAFGDDLEYADNPMLVLLTAHLLVRSQGAVAGSRRYEPAADSRLRTAFWMLQEELGPHPDVLALSVALGMRNNQHGGRAPWPPMLAASLDLLLAADTTNAEVIPPGSPIEAVIGQRYAGEPWLLWDPTGLSLADRGRAGGARGMPRPGQSLPLPPFGTTANEPVQPGGVTGGGPGSEKFASERENSWARWPNLPSALPPSPGAVSRVWDLLTGVAGRMEIDPVRAAARLGDREVARRLGISTALVASCLDDIRAGHPPF